MGKEADSDLLKSYCNVYSSVISLIECVVTGYWLFQGLLPVIYSATEYYSCYITCSELHVLTALVPCMVWRLLS